MKLKKRFVQPKNFGEYFLMFYLGADGIGEMSGINFLERSAENAGNCKLPWSVVRKGRRVCECFCCW